MSSLEFKALHWLKWEKRCLYATMERTPRYLCGSRPDLLGITNARRIIEIEVKRTMSDFRANMNKRHVAYRPMHIDRWPHYFYFIVPDTIAEKVEAELPEYAGLLVHVTDDSSTWVREVRKSPVNAAAKKLSGKEAVQFSRLQSNHIYKLERDMLAFRYPESVLQPEYFI